MYNVLLIGSGGREHALAWKLAQSKLLNRLYIAPGNPGTAAVGTNVAVAASDFAAIKETVLNNAINMVMVGPEDPLVNGLADFFAADPQLAAIPVIGPCAAGARLEGSKDFAKNFMQKYRIPTARYHTVTLDTLAAGEAFIDTLRTPYVLKADGLAAGKGVLIIDSKEEAKEQLRAMLHGLFGKAGSKVVIEEFLQGIEVSVFVLTDGKSYKLLPEAKDYKRIGEGDSGPNTGGMGAVSPVPFATPAFLQKVEQQIVQPTIAGLQQEGIAYKGFIFFGLMNVGGEPYVIEYNVRMGDPETEAVMLRLDTDLLDLLEGVARQTLAEKTVTIVPATAVTVVCVSGGYPEGYAKGYPIKGLEQATGSIVFQAGTAFDDNKQVVTAGGRVLAVTALGNSIDEARTAAYSTVDTIQYEGMYFRTDIGNDLINKTIAMKKIISDTGKYGLVDATGKEITPCIYDYINEFHEGLAWVKKEKKWGYINTAGKEIVPCRYDQISDFYQGVAKVNINGKYGLINSSCQEIVPCIYDYMQNFKENLAKVKKEEKWGYINTAGQEIIPCIYDYVDDCKEGFVRVKKEEKWGYMNTAGKEITPCIYDEITYFDSNNLAAVTKKGKYGFIDTTGKEVIPCIYYDDVNYNIYNTGSQGLYSIYEEDFYQDLVFVTKGKKMGYLDTTGKEIIPCIYNNLEKFNEGLAAVLRSKKYGFIDTTGKEVIPCIYDRAWDFCNGFAKVRNAKKYGFIDTTGKEVAPCIYNDVYQFHEGLASVKKGRKWGFIDTTGKEIIPCIYNEMGDYPVFHQGLAEVKKGNKRLLINSSGEEITSGIFDRKWAFCNGLAKIEKNGKYGLINTAGKVIAPCIYDDVGYYIDILEENCIYIENGLAKVKKNGKWGFIDTTGKEVLPCIYDTPGVYDDTGRFYNDLAKVYKNGKYGFINMAGEEIIPCAYNEVKLFDDGWAKVKKNGKWGYIDTTGKEIIPCIYDDVCFLDKGFLQVKKNKLWGFIDSTGKEITPCIYDDAYFLNKDLAKVKKDKLWGFIDSTGKEITPCIYEKVGNFNFLDKNCIYIENDWAKVKKNGKWGLIDTTGKEVIPCIYDEDKALQEIEQYSSKKSI